MLINSDIAKMMIKMVIQFWQKDKKLVINENAQSVIKSFKSNKLSGLMNITMEQDSMFAAQNELQNKRLIEVLNMFRGTGLINEAEMMKQIVQNQ